MRGGNKNYSLVKKKEGGERRKGKEASTLPMIFARSRTGRVGLLTPKISFEEGKKGPPSPTSFPATRGGKEKGKVALLSPRSYKP